MTMASFHSVSFAYGEREVLRDVSFDVVRGEMLGVAGPNGAGKSTLIGLASGVLAPVGGEVRISGRPCAGYSRQALSREVAVVPQSSESIFPYTVEEVVAMGRYPHLGWGGWLGEDDRGACEHALDLAGAAKFKGRCLDELSAGERQRVYLARALAQDPALLLLDEASSFLDIGQELAVFQVLDRLRREESLTILTVSHDLNLIGTFCQKVLLLKDGKIQAAGDLEENFTGANLTALFGTPVAASRRDAGGVRVSW
jgi:iron complex transport system ATP-binding protein